MRIYNYDDFDWNRCVAPEGNAAGVHPQTVADMCDRWGVPWWSSSWPYSGGLKAYCLDDKIWNRIIKMSK